MIAHVDGEMIKRIYWRSKVWLWMYGQARMTPAERRQWDIDNYNRWKVSHGHQARQ